MRISARMEVNENARDALDPQVLSGKVLRNFREQVLELEGTVRQTSPVDKGLYKALWRTEFSAGGRIAELINPQKYAQFLIYGTHIIEGAQGRITSALAHAGGRFAAKAEASRNRRYPKADLSRGILHDVRAIIFEWKEKAVDIMKEDTLK